MLLGTMSKLYKIQGTNIMNAITIGNNIVQQKVINWSNLIRGNDALIHIKIKIIIQDFSPIIKAEIIRTSEGSIVKNTWSKPMFSIK